MNNYPLPLVISLSVLVTIAGCGEGPGTNGVFNDSLYTGQKFNEHIRSTEARTPEEERKGFRLPEGFEITLFASEPDIGKPINLTFDAKGRVWVTQSFEYPFPAVPGKGKDRVSILEDTDNDGKADKFTHFSDSLNIPIGILPVTDGAIVYSIPNVYKFIDANGDGKPESSTRLMGPFETRDTHGMVNNFTFGYDGWIHGCHGYSNRSTVAGADGDSVHLVSGNTIRFRPDGSRVEVETYGRINPFGLTYDELGYLYSTDCHTSPLYQLIRGGDYTQWGKEEAMGFAPDMKPFENEATALAGITYYADTKYPEAYRSNLYIGDAVSSRVYRNSFTWKGSSPVGKKEEDFVLSADPWFRPVDVKMGPDGAIYIADFYNSIIGHYEVPLDHPKRDRIRGRVWKITYKGKTNNVPDLQAAGVSELFAALKSDNLPTRIMATTQLVERIGRDAVEPAKAILEKKDASVREYIHSVWALQRLSALDDAAIERSLASNDPVIRVHTLRAVGEQKDTSAALYPMVLKALEDGDPHVRRAAVELTGRYFNMESVEKLVAFRKKIPQEDSHLIYTVRLTLRNLLRRENLMQEVAARQWTAEDKGVLASVMRGVQTPTSGAFLYECIRDRDLDKTESPKDFLHIMRFAPGALVQQVIETGREKGGKDSDLEFLIFKSLQEGLARRGAKESPAFVSWGKSIIANVMKKNLKAGKEAERTDAEVVEQQFAITLAGDYKVTSVEDKLAEVLADSSQREDIRAAAMRSLLKMDAGKHAALAGKILQAPESNPLIKRLVVIAVSEFPGTAVNNVLASQVKNAPPDLQQVIVLGLAGSAAGRNLLFDKVKNGEIFPRVLAEPKVEERLMLNISPAQKAVYEQLTANLEAVDKERQGMINGRIADYNNLAQKPSPESGQPIFLKNCSPCHSLNGAGGAIGPQLDGVGKWGVGPLSEKILDPNRNVSENFRTYTLKLKDGKVLTGLYRRDEGQVIVFADASGQEFSVSKQEIEKREASKYTLMPDQFRNTLSQEEFNALISFLLSQKS